MPRRYNGPWTDEHVPGLVLAQLMTGEDPYEGDDSGKLFQLRR